MPLLALALSFFLLKNYFVPGIQIILGMMIAPFVFEIKEKGKYSSRYAWAVLVFAALYALLHIYVLLFFATGCLLFFTIEKNWGKIGLLPFLFLVAISPAMHYAVNTFTFTIRLALSKYAAIVLNAIGYAVQNHGNYFIMPDGQSFSVDTACVGLNMFNTGLCLVVLMLGVAQKKYKRQISVMSLSAIFFSAVVLLILTNFLRILVIVLFRSMPGTFSHEFIGIFSLLLYTAVPAFLFVEFVYKRFPQQIRLDITEQKNTSFVKNLIRVSALALILLTSYFFVDTLKKNIVKDEKLRHLQLQGFTKTFAEDGVVEYRKDSVLIYIKPANKAFESDHPPNMCWQGAGFNLEEVTETMFGNFTILTATLKKKNKVQYTAWWYDNGLVKTSSQWKWRTTCGEPFRTINITASGKKELDLLCREYLEKKLF